MDKEPLCARCARIARTCCQDNEIYVTPVDVKRIAVHTGLTGFWQYHAPDNVAYLDQDDDPLWAECTLRADGTRRVLRLVPGGNCMFLSPTGCMLPLEVRPLVCRLHPYQYTEAGIDSEPASGCPRSLMASTPNLFAAIGMNLGDARRWHQQLYAEIRLEKTNPCALV